MAFVIRDDRRFRIVEHAGGSTTELVPWTESHAIAPLAEGDVTAENALAVDVTEETIVFFVNDEKVADLPRAGVDAEGGVGLRAGDGVSLHVTSLAVGAIRR